MEFQQRGAPHVHSLLWLKNQKKEEAPNLWKEQEDSSNNQDNGQQDNSNLQNEDKIRDIEKLADFLISTNSKDISCGEHLTDAIEKNACIQCGILRDKIEKFQYHNHTFTCEKKKKSMTIKSNEGHGRLDNMINWPDLINIPVCNPCKVYVVVKT